MTDQSIEQNVSDHSRSIAQIHEILLLLARRQQETERVLGETALQQQANAQQIAANAEAIAELRVLMQDRYGGNGQRGE